MLDSTDVAAEAAAVADDSLELKGMTCGYTEGSETTQTAAGIGCALLYENAEAMGTLAEEKVEWVSLTEDSSIDLGMEQPPTEVDDDEEATTIETTTTSEDDIPE